MCLKYFFKSIYAKEISAFDGEVCFSKVAKRWNSVVQSNLPVCIFPLNEFIPITIRVVTGRCVLIPVTFLLLWHFSPFCYSPGFVAFLPP